MEFHIKEDAINSDHYYTDTFKHNLPPFESFIKQGEERNLLL